MDHTRFDRLSYMLADTRLRSRRGVLATLGVAVLGAITGVEAEPAHARRKSRQHTDRQSGHPAKRKSRHDSNPRHHDARGQLHAAGRSLQPKPDSRCGRSISGTPCQDAICTGKTTLRPACTCDAQGQCVCPDPVACPNHLACLTEKGVCLTDCVADDDCANGYSCQPDGTCSYVLSCDCSNLNFCSGHGSCTPVCTCVCDVGWIGAACSELPQGNCSDHLTCEECEQDTLNACIFCTKTQDGLTGVCTPSDVCLIAQEC